MTTDIDQFEYQKTSFLKAGEAILLKSKSIEISEFETKFKPDGDTFVKLDAEIPVLITKTNAGQLSVFLRENVKKFPVKLKYMGYISKKHIWEQII